MSTVDDHYIPRDGASGYFGCGKFPRNRETRAPLVSELLPHKDEIDPKYSSFDAPTEDDAGNKTLIRFSRKTKEQYVQSEVNKKATAGRPFIEAEMGSYKALIIF